MAETLRDRLGMALVSALLISGDKLWIANVLPVH